jgi:hypothetical protein
MLPRVVEGGWRIGDYFYAENPRFTVPSWCVRLVHVWARIQRLRGGGLVPGAAVLPVNGGFGDQPALVMDAFEMFDHWAESRRAVANGST